MTPAPATPTITLIHGDGIGPEIMEATLRLLEAAGARLSFEQAWAGLEAVDRDRDPLPAATLSSIERHRVALKGPLATPKGEGFRSVNVALRQHFDLYANVRPVRSFAGLPARYGDVDLVIVRENTEDIYLGVEHYVGPGRTAAESIAVITRHGSERIVRYALDYARAHGRRRVTLVHKANILKLSNGLFLDVGREVARGYPDVDFEDMIVDTVTMRLVLDPRRFDVIVTTNVFGDILSDLCAGLAGGLGIAPGANIGKKIAIFEAIHGTAPDIAGRGLANPVGLMLAAGLMLDHLGQTEAAARLRGGVAHALEDEAARTVDVGGRGTTRSFADAAIRWLEQVG